MYLNQPVSYNEIPKAFLPKNQGIFVSEDMLETNGDCYFSKYQVIFQRMDENTCLFLLLSEASLK